VWLTIAVALLKALPHIMRLVNFLAAKVAEREQRAIGREQAIKEALIEAHKELAMADAARLEAEAGHRKDDTDAAFDQEFRRHE
jgi:hypothetical protein